MGYGGNMIYEETPVGSSGESEITFGTKAHIPQLVTKSDVGFSNVDNNKYKWRFKMDGFWKMMVYDTYRDTFDGIWNFLGSLFLTFILAFFLGLAFYMVDTIGVDPYETTGTQVDTNFVAAHMMPVTTTVGKSTITTYVWIDDAWFIHVNLDAYRGTVSCPVSQGAYRQYVKDSFTTIDAITGRLSGSTYCNRMY